jgi:hypothetical protein
MAEVASDLAVSKDEQFSSQSEKQTLVSCRNWWQTLMISCHNWCPT